MKHTPGPWGIKTTETGTKAIFSGSSGAWVAHTVRYLSSTQEANARLISAAPDLLEALKDTWDVLDAAGLHNLSNGVQLGQTVWYVKACDAKRSARAAIDKATGEQQ
jgi:hypothetical protein